MTLKIKIVSDIHLEFGDIDISNSESADVLILSGDICVADDLDRNIPDYNPYTQGVVSQLGKRQLSAVRYLNFFERVSADYPHVIYVAGNHEFYQGNWVKTLEVLRVTVSKFPNIHFLENGMFELGDITFVGGTLWTDMNRGDPVTMHGITGMLNDFRLIRNDEIGYTRLRPAHVASRHRSTFDYIRNVIEGQIDKKFVVVTHHAPTPLSIHDYYKDNYIMNGAYASDLSEFILDHPQIKLWTCGHVHHPHWYYMGDTLVACNPRGYVGEEHITNFNKNFVIDLDNMPSKDLVDKNYNHSLIS